MMSGDFDGAEEFFNKVFESEPDCLKEGTLNSKMTFVLEQ
jgi:hypothetical protein